MLNPGADLSTPVELIIDFASSLEFRVNGSVTGNGNFDPTPGNNGDELSEVLVTAGPVVVSGTAGFALTRSTTDVDLDGNAGAAELSGAQVDQIALALTNAKVNVEGVAYLELSGVLGLARVTASGNNSASYTAIKISDVAVSASSAQASDFGLSGTLEVDGLEYHNAVSGGPLDWTGVADATIHAGSRLSVD